MTTETPRTWSLAGARACLYAAAGFVLVLAAPSVVRAAELFVGPGETYATIQGALDVAVEGDVITVRGGSYEELLETQAPGVVLRAEPGAEVLVQGDGRALWVFHPRVRVEGLVFDGAYGDRDVIDVEDGADDFALVGAEVRRSGRNCIDIGAVSSALVERSLIHHCLRSSAADCAEDACRVDAHGIVGGPVQGLTIRDTEIHTFSGDAVQLDPDRDAPGWTDLRIEGCRFWLGPLPSAEGGFAAGVVPGENAIDTKTPDDGASPSRLTIVDTHAWGFRDGLIGRMSAFNLKENVEATIDRVTVHDSQVAFRLRGATGTRPRGVQVTIRNAVVWASGDEAVRYGDDIEPVAIRNSTFGGDLARVFRGADAPEDTIRGANVLVLAEALPAELAGGSNLAVPPAAFVDAAGHDYRLAAGAAAIDAGEALSDVALDRDGVPRPQGSAWDVGAFERCADPCDAPDGGPPVADGGATSPDGGGADASAPPADGGGDLGSDGGCGCTVPVGPMGPLPRWSLLLLLLATRRLRRRP